MNSVLTKVFINLCVCACLRCMYERVCMYACMCMYVSVIQKMIRNVSKNKNKNGANKMGRGGKGGQFHLKPVILAHTKRVMCDQTGKQCTDMMHGSPQSCCSRQQLHLCISVNSAHNYGCLPKLCTFITLDIF